MITWTIGTGESGCTDSLQRAADAATTAAATWLHTHAPTTLGWDGPATTAITVRVEGTETRLVPAYDRCGHYDPDATTRAAHHLRDTITGAAELTMAATTP